MVEAWFAEDPCGAWNAFLERPSPDQRAVLGAAIKAEEHRYWIIEAGQQVGLVRLSTKDRPAGVAALLYYVARAHRNRGHAARAVERVVRHALDDLGFTTIVADVLLTNEPSGRLLKKLGFERTGKRTLARTDRGPEQLEEWRRAAEQP